MLQSMDLQGAINVENLSVGVVFWQKDDGIAPLMSGLIKEYGCKTVNFLWDENLPDDLDVVWAYAPFGSLAPLACQLRDRPPARRPKFVFWLTEPLPNPRLPEWIRYPVSALRSTADRVAFRQQPESGWHVIPQLRLLTSRAHRFRYYGDLLWLHRQGLLSVLAVPSPIVAQAFRAHGLNPIVAHPGSHPDWWADLKLERDIPVLWLGKIATHRRRLLLQRVRAELKSHGVELLSIDGVEHPYVFGYERTVLLNRTVVVLNLLREEYDDNSLRFSLAAPNRALIISEPMLPHTPFKPGTHFIESPIDQITDTILCYLSDREARERIVEQAFQVSTTEITMQKAVNKVLQAVLQSFPERMNA